MAPLAQSVERPKPRTSGCPLDEDSLREFGRELSEVGKRAFAKVGQSDLDDLVAVDNLARRLTKLGRVLIHVSVDPLTFSGGVISLFLGQQLNKIEVCHAVLHGTYDEFDHPHLHSKRVTIYAPISEEGWTRTHLKHHPNVNIVGRDPDARFGVLRQNEYIPYQPHHRFQALPLISNFIWLSGQLNLMITGVADLHMREADDSCVASDRSRETYVKAHRLALSKAIPYYLKTLVAYPAIAGPFFPKVLLGNVLADTLRNVYTAATVYSGHISEEHVYFPPGTKAGDKNEWYWMQVVASANFEVPEFMSRLSGGLDQHIEHHLFPTLPPRRLRKIAPEVRAICEKHGVPYKTAKWPATLRGVWRRFASLSRPPGKQEKRA